MFISGFLSALVNMSITASVAIALVILARLALRRAPKIISYALWGIVLFRLLCPVSIESAFSIFSLLDRPVKTEGALTGNIEYVPEGFVPDSAAEILPDGTLSVEASPEPSEKANSAGLSEILTGLWLAGVLGMGIYGAVSYFKLRRRLVAASRLQGNVYLADGIESPFVMGLFRPKIYLPSELSAGEREYILLHEELHIKRLDHVTRLLAFFALCVHWFNPLVWAAFAMSGRDMEMSCDEAVVKKLGLGVRAEYSASLLSFATGRKILAGMPLAFGEGDPKGRIKNLASFKRPTFWVIGIGAVAAAVLAVCLLTNPKSSAGEKFAGGEFEVCQVTYESGIYSYTVTAGENSPSYSISPDMVLGIRSYEPGWDRDIIGCMLETELTKDNFDSLFHTGREDWHGRRSAAHLRRGNLRAWMHEYRGKLYILLQQKNGDLYMCEGNVDLAEKGDKYSDDSNIRWVFKLENSKAEDKTGLMAGIKAAIQSFFGQTRIKTEDIADYTAHFGEASQQRKNTMLEIDIFPCALPSSARVEKFSYLYYNPWDPNYTGVLVYTCNGEEYLQEIARLARIGVPEDYGLYGISGFPYTLCALKTNEYGAVYAMTDADLKKIIYGEIIFCNYFSDCNYERIIGENYLPLGFDAKRNNAVRRMFERNGTVGENTGLELEPGSVLVPYQCIYMSPESSNLAFGGDSGYSYEIRETSFVKVSRNGFDPTVIPVESWVWQEFPYSDAEWADMFSSVYEIPDISEIYSVINYLPLDSRLFLMSVDGALWLVDHIPETRFGPEIQSIYSLVPESAMGSAVWEYSAVSSAGDPVFEFKLDMEFTRINAGCSAGELVGLTETEDGRRFYPEGASIRWSPLVGGAQTADRTEITFSAFNGDSFVNGVIYIEKVGAEGSARTYRAALVGTGLYLEQNTESGGGIIKFANRY